MFRTRPWILSDFQPFLGCSESKRTRLAAFPPCGQPPGLRGAGEMAGKAFLVEKELYDGFFEKI